MQFLVIKQITIHRTNVVQKSDKNKPNFLFIFFILHTNLIKIQCWKWLGNLLNCIWFLPNNIITDSESTRAPALLVVYCRYFQWFFLMWREGEMEGGMEDGFTVWWSDDGSCLWKKKKKETIVKRKIIIHWATHECCSLKLCCLTSWG